MQTRPESDPGHTLEEHAPRFWRRLGAGLDPRAALMLRLAVAFVIVAALSAGFIALAVEFPEQGSLARFDLAVDTWLHTHGTPFGDDVFLVVSWFGVPILMAIEFCVAVWLAKRRAWLDLTAWLVTLAGAAALDQLLKLTFHRARPVYAVQFIHRPSWSFPSGHAMNSIVGYTMLAYLLMGYVHGRRAREGLVLAAIVLIIAVGYARMYLGVHYPSDVLGGWLAGGAWVIACITAYRIARRRWGPRPAVGPGTDLAPDGARTTHRG